MRREHDPIRDDRILNLIIADCFGEDEEAAGWYHHWAATLQFPMAAALRSSLSDAPLDVHTVQVVGIDPQSEHGQALRLGITDSKNPRVRYIRPEELASVSTSPECLQAINDWLYWHNYDLLPDTKRNR